MFSSIDEIKKIISEKKIGNIILHEKLMEDFEGMLESYYIIFNLEKKKIRLTNLFECKGIDFYGDDFYEEHEYDFGTVDEIISYVEGKLGIKLSEMKQVKNFPSPLDSDTEKTALYRENWDRFVYEFKKGKFIDNTLKLASIK